MTYMLAMVVKKMIVNAVQSMKVVVDGSLNSSCGILALIVPANQRVQESREYHFHLQ